MFALRDILDATGGKLISAPRDNIVVEGISADSRTIKKGELFVAIEGTNYNGHDFVNDASRNGAVAAVVSRADLRADIALIQVSDTLKALGDIATFNRKRFDTPVVAITGTSGKTTTKEMIASALAVKFRILKNRGTENNFIGLPLALVNLNCQYDISILEMGTSRKGEIENLTRIASPNTGIITNIGQGHLESFGTKECIFKEKFKLIEHLPPTGLAILNLDDPMLSLAKQKKNIKCKLVSFGINNPNCDYRAGKIVANRDHISFLLNTREPFKIRAVGRHNVYNALCAIATARSFGLDYESIRQGLNNFQTPPMRMYLRNLNGISIIEDCYNSNPQSMQAAIQALSDFETEGKRIVFFGDMLELGKESDRLHYYIGLLLAKSKIDILVTVGKLSCETLQGAIEAGINREFTLSFSCIEEAAKGFPWDVLEPGDVVLIKGSRMMQMEKILQCFTHSCAP
jgi:UDP-N-acetylmuramoyl-tripeptide--D-alanyl-D-alanine ligase